MNWSISSAHRIHQLLAFVMKETESERYLGRVEPSVLFGKTPLPLHVEHEVSTVHQFDHKE